MWKGNRAVGEGLRLCPRDPVIEAYEQGLDRTLIQQNLRRTPEERLANLAALQRFVTRFRGAAWTRTRSPAP